LDIASPRTNNPGAAVNRIRLLSEQVANQIAAGEVIERPASIVKELVENALDAGALRIQVEVQAGGRSLIRVTDDGSGMSRDDALLCLERHATSKIQKAEDLAAIVTMGFRGEALPSIASVSRFQIVTRERASGEPEGTRVVVNGGRIIEVQAAGAPAGTAVEVRQVFFNMPARRKFLRSEETERAHIQHYLTLAALAHPEVALAFHSDQRLVWQLPAVPTIAGVTPMDALRERMRVLHSGDRALLAFDHSAVLTPIHSDSDDDASSPQPTKVRVWGLIGTPGVSRSTRDEQHLFVNRRPVENRGLNFALLEGYHTMLMKGRYPVCCIFLELDPAEVDINIHPAKREVKFHREREVRQIVTAAVRQALLKFHLGPVSASPASPAPSKPADGASPSRPEPAQADLLPKAIYRPPAAPLPASDSSRSKRGPTDKPPAYPGPTVSTAPAPAIPQQALTASPVPTLQPSAVPLLAVPLRIVGVIGKLYVLMESDRGLVLMDQHAAHERVLFEEMLKRLEHGDAASQRLLLPETVELSPKDAQFLRHHLGTLARLGVGLSEFGDRTFLLDALPPFVKSTDARRFVVELVDELKSAGEGVNPMRLGEHMIAKTVCRHAVKANDLLAGPELEKLLEQLRHCDMPYTCPHGRPTLIEMAYRELEKKFGRTQ
jgi:DNA mismatch repair protein MutL